jgi:hypothetical protein
MHLHALEWLRAFFDYRCLDGHGELCDGRVRIQIPPVSQRVVSSDGGPIHPSDPDPLCHALSGPTYMARPSRTLQVRLQEKIYSQSYR